MTRRSVKRGSRTGCGPGSGARRRALVPWLVAVVGAVACAPVGAPRDAPPPPDPPPPAIERGASSPSEEAAAARLLASAGEALETGDFRRALAEAQRVVEEFPTTPGSSEALLVVARAALALDDPERAAAAAGDYADLLPAGSAAAAEARILEGDAQRAAGDPRAAVTAWLRVPRGTPAQADALARIREEAPALPTDVLGELLSGDAPTRPQAAPLLAEYAIAWHLRGDGEEARRWARQLLALEPPRREAEIGRAILADRLEEVLGPAPSLGAILPAGGVPTLQQFADLVEEGVRMALESEGARSRIPVRLVVVHDRGDATTAGELARSLSGQGALGLVGPLMDRAVEAAARARNGPVPIISPTARLLPDGARAVYSLAGPDPTPSRTLARYALETGIRSVVVLHSRTAGPTYEANVFADAFRGGGGSVLRQIAYDSGATHFEEPLRAAADARPEALVLPLEPGDIAVLAPQIAFYGLDELGIRILGTAGWASEVVARQVEPRHTDGVVAVSPRPPGATLEAHDRFVGEYEAAYRRSLRSPVPALGYDAAGLLLAAYRTGARTPEALAAALERVTDHPGATGLLSVENGRIVRRHYLFRYQDREMVPVDGPPPDPAPSTGR